MPKRNRHSWSAAEKLRIVLAGMEPGTEVSSLCLTEGISPTQYYSWKKQLESSAEDVFGNAKKKVHDSREAKLKSELARMKRVIAEITAENLELKKSL